MVSGKVNLAARLGINSSYTWTNYVCSGPLQINRGDPAHLFNTACFTPSFAGVLGSSPRNAYYGPGLVDFDASLMKRFSITERVAFSFRAANRIEANGTFG